MLTWPNGYSDSVTAYLQGGGGGGGGTDAQVPGGNGTGGGYCSVNFTIAAGDQLEISVGGGGGGGGSNTNGGNATPGRSLDTGLIWSTLDSGYVKQYQWYWTGWLNDWAVWNSNPYSRPWVASSTVTFPNAGSYNFAVASSGYGPIYVDGQQVMNYSGYGATVYASFYISAGPHTISWNIETAGDDGTAYGGLGIIITTGGQGYSGGYGGGAGYGGRSGAGGAGGGATVLRKNGVIIAVAGGGAGGGGAGVRGGDGNAPVYSRGFDINTTAGQNGGNHPGDGGGGGGGGGGRYGGNAGYWGGGAPIGADWNDVTGQGGMFGISLGTNVVDPNGKLPGSYGIVAGLGGGGGTGYPQGAYYDANENYVWPYKQQGENGGALFVFETVGVSVFTGTWRPVKKTWVNTAVGWQVVQGTYIKDPTTPGWAPILGTMPPYFVSAPGFFGPSGRPAPPYNPSE